MPLTIVTFGSSRLREGDEGYLLALECGRIVARRGLQLVSGGYAGTMEAASRGAREEGGIVVGITTPIFARREPNPHLGEMRVEPDYPARLAALLRAGDLYLCFPGGLGTVSEWLTAWCLASIGQLRGPLWCFREPFLGLAGSVQELPEIGAGMGRHLHWLEDAAEFEVELDRWLDGRGSRS